MSAIGGMSSTGSPAEEIEGRIRLGELVKVEKAPGILSPMSERQRCLAEDLGEDCWSQGLTVRRDTAQ